MHHLIRKLEFVSNILRMFVDQEEGRTNVLLNSVNHNPDIDPYFGLQETSSNKCVNRLLIKIHKYLTDMI